MSCCCRDGHGYPCIDQGPSLGGFAKSEDGSADTDLFSSEGDDEVELEKSNVLLLGPTGVMPHTAGHASVTYICRDVVLLNFVQKHVTCCYMPLQHIALRSHLSRAC